MITKQPHNKILLERIVFICGGIIPMTLLGLWLLGCAASIIGVWDPTENGLASIKPFNALRAEEALLEVGSDILSKVPLGERWSQKLQVHYLLIQTQAEMEDPNRPVMIAHPSWYDNEARMTSLDKRHTVWRISINDTYEDFTLSEAAIQKNSKKQLIFGL